MNHFFYNITLRFILVFALLSGAMAAPAQQRPDSTLRFRADSIAAKRAADSIQAIKMLPDTSLQAFYRINSYVNTSAPVVYQPEQYFYPREKDMLFYLLAAMLLCLGIIRLLFAKYFSDMFLVFFQTTFRQKSIREQLLQNKMASLLLNVFFCLSGGLFLYLVAISKGWLPVTGFYQKAAFCIALVAVVYSIKYIGLQLSGWLFGLREVTETYSFIVFMINKVMGVLLLIPVIILALGSTGIQPGLLVLSSVILVILFLYRYIIAMPLMRNQSGIAGFHFFIYLCAFEIVPVLLVYKLLLVLIAR